MNKKLLTGLISSLLLFGCDSPISNGNSVEPKSNESSSTIASSIPEGYVKADGMKQFEASQENGIYNYCPSIMEENGVRHVYYCTNKDFNNIRDHIGYRKGLLIDGEWYYSPETLVLSPTNDTWDAIHTCDPSVIQGEFNYQGERYNYLMAYLGCITTDCQANEVGLAIAKNPEGPWIKPDNINHFVEYKMVSDNSAFQWGFGQPSLVSVDKKGKVLLFYTYGSVNGSGTLVEKWDFSDIDNPVEDEQFKAKYDFQYRSDTPKRGIIVKNRGLSYSVNGTNRNETINNADFCYDETKKRFYLIGEGYPFPEEEGDYDQPQVVAARSKVCYLNDTGNEIGDVFLNQTAQTKWTKIYTVDYKDTSFKRNHNGGIVTSNYGHVDNMTTFDCFVTISQLNKPVSSLYTYRIYEFKFEIDDLYLN